MVAQFKANGWSVAACARTVAASWVEKPDLALQCDVTQPNEVKQTINETVKEFGSIDVLINNAGLAGNTSLEPSDSDDYWHDIINVNLNGTYYFSKYSIPHIPNGGRIINVGSVLSFKGVSDGIAYCAAKHAVLGFTRALAHNLAPKNITVNAICPGWTRTEMALGRMKEISMTEEHLKSSVPLGRFIEPSEIAAFALYLASDTASGITGQSFTIDGGSLA
jgi:NAD(P)-dependent dehydrogenase (short-subunit alcohol dehydrogenase family)